MSNLGYVQWYPANPLSHGTCDYLVGDGRCGRPAEWVRKWQTQVMPAPSYWYFCDDHATVPKEGHV